jgi:hypothetical protein
MSLGASFMTKMSSHREQWNLGVSRAATAAVSTAKLVLQEGHTTTMCGAGTSNLVVSVELGVSAERCR